MTRNKSHLGQAVTVMPEAQPTLPQTIADLRAAADLLERDGWCQHAARDGEKRCIGMAIHDTVSDAATEEGAGRRMNRALYAVMTHLKTRSLTGWNDVQGRTAVEVVAALRGAAARLELGA